MRRALGLLTMLFMLHLSLVGADFACAQHGHRAGSSMSMGPMEMTSHAPAHAAAAHVDGEQPQCDTPATPECCNALASCGPTYDVETHRAPTSIGARAVPPLAWSAIAAAHVVAPETPPPRA